MTRKDYRQLLTLLAADLHSSDSHLIHERVFKIPQFTPRIHKIHVLTGVRRSGKSTLQRKWIHELLNQDVSSEQILMINLEDERLLPMTAQELGGLLDAFFELHPENHHRTVYFFLDEIQNVDGWASVVRRMHDRKNVEICLTGSSAKLLSREINTSLRGRSLGHEIYPLGFVEALGFQGERFELPKTRGGFDRYLKILFTFLEAGGFPEIQEMGNERSPSNQELRVSILQNYFQVMLFRDLVERHQVANETVLRAFLKILLAQTGREISINKIYHDLKSRGFSITKDKLYDFSDWSEDAYITFLVPVFSDSIRKQQTRPKKAYSIDSGLVRSMVLRQTEDQGRYFENLVFLDLKRAGYDVFYGLTDDNAEVDFIATHASRPTRAIQVSLEEGFSNSEAEERNSKWAKTTLGSELEFITPRSYFRFLKENFL